MRLRPCFRAVDNTLCSGAKSCAPPLRAERARNLHAQFHHADVSLSLIVHERHSGIVQEAQRLSRVNCPLDGLLQPPSGTADIYPLPITARLQPSPRRKSGQLPLVGQGPTAGVRSHLRR